MGRILVFLLGTAIVFGAAYVYVTGGNRAQAGSEASAPKQTLDHVRQAADQIEVDAQRRADELLERTSGDQIR